MADDAAAPAANDTPTPVAAPTGDVSVADAAAFLHARRTGAPTPQPVAPEPAAAAETESPSQEEDAGTEEPRSTDETAEDDLAGEPPIARPKSWPKEQDEAWQTLPRHLQEIAATVDRQRESEFLRGKSEAAQERQTAAAERQAAEQARQQYEQALPNLLQSFQAQFATEFQDIKTWADVEGMQDSDPLRFQRWTLAKQKGESLQREAEQAQHRQRHEQAQRWKDYVAEQDEAFFSKAPEFKDPARKAKVEAEADAMFADLGFSKQELTELANGRQITFTDHRLRLMLRDAVRYRQAEKARKAAQPKPVPPVQRPGVATSRGESSSTNIRDLTNKVKSTGSVDAAVALLRARRNAAAR